jgi:hypothetical protein
MGSFEKKIRNQRIEAIRKIKKSDKDFAHKLAMWVFFEDTFHYNNSFEKKPIDIK